jgi:uncharacterized protein (DUF849 family)
MLVTISGTMITVAPTGAEASKAETPALPVTLDELLSTASSCEQAGASVIHVHVRDKHGQPSLDLSLLRETVIALREQTSLVVQLSTGGSVHDGYDARLSVLDANPDSCSVTCGTVNFGDDVFMNPWPFIVELYQATQDREIVPEFELFDLGQIAAVNRLLDLVGTPYGGQVHCDLVMGVPGGMPGTAEAVVAAVRMLPEGCSWSATGIGRSSLGVALSALASGGHLRVGMEDTVTFARGIPVTDNAQLVSRACQLADLAQRPALTTEEARVLLNIKDRRRHAVSTASGGK